MTSSQPVAFEWAPITDLPEDWYSISRPDLDEALEAWRREKVSLRDPRRRERLEERLATEWAIETGVIERLYTVDRGVTETLIDLGLQALKRFTTAGRLDRSAILLIEDQRAALEFVFEMVKDDRPLSTSSIKELHQLLTRHQSHTDAVDQFGNRVRVELLRGDWKKQPNNPLRPDGSIHEYCPPEFVQDEIESLLRLHEAHRVIGVRPEVEAAWLHHRFTQIHPFQDGNGRIARALATLVFLQSDFLPLVIRDSKHKEQYIAALEAADAGDLQQIVNLFANIEASDLDSAITFVRQIRSEGVSTIAAAAASAAKRRQVEREEDLAQVTSRLVGIAKDRLDEVSRELRQSFAKEDIGLRLDVRESDEDNQDWWYGQIVSAAKQYGYYADLSRPRKWVQLRLNLQTIGAPRMHIVASFHYKDVRSGVMAAIVFLTGGEMGFESERTVDFGSATEFSYSSTTVLVEEYFRQWFDDALLVVLDRWQARL